MENIAKSSTKSLSPPNQPKRNDAINMSPTHNAFVAVARNIERGRSGGGGERRRRHSSENIRIPWQVVELSSGEGIGRKTRSLPMAMSDSIKESKFEVIDNVEGFPKKSTGTSIVNHKRKLPEGTLYSSLALVTIYLFVYLISPNV